MKSTYEKKGDKSPTSKLIDFDKTSAYTQHSVSKDEKAGRVTNIPKKRTVPKPKAAKLGAGTGLSDKDRVSLMSDDDWEKAKLNAGVLTNR